MLRQLTKYLYILGIGLSLGVLFFMRTGDVYANKLNFSAQAQIPENQVDKKKTYFDLLVKPGSKQDLIIKLRNDTDKDVNVKIGLHTARTNLNGVIEYGGSKDKLDKSLVYKISDILKPESNLVKIPAKSSVDTKLKLVVPKKVFLGTLVGGITLKESKKVNGPKVKNGLSNEYQYIIGTVLRESIATVPSQIKLGRVSAAQVNARNTINAEFRNVKPKLMSNLNIVGTVKDKSGKVLYQRNEKDIKMAPNSILNYAVQLNGNKLKPGKYLYTAKVADESDEWQFKKWFTVTEKQAKKYNDQDVSIEQQDWTWLIVLVIAVVLIITWFAIRKFREKGE